MDFENHSETDIAIIGMSLRVPGAATPDKFWSNLQNGVESIADLTDEELRAAGVSENLIQDPSYVKRHPPLDGVEWFDAGFFDLNPREAAVMDPQHRLFLECGLHALEDSGCDPTRFDGSIGVFGGSGFNGYMPYNLLSNPELVDSMGFFLIRHTGNDKDFLTTRLSYNLNLTGPSINVQTACSTSLVAVHLAAQSLIAGECEVALAGGCTIEMPLRHGYLYKPSEILSPDGHCRAFDAKSAGTIFGSGCGVVVLKQLDEAIAAGDNIRAVIKGSALNNDGAGKAGYLAPSVDGQAKAISEALEFSDVAVESIGYVEAHGTGTSVGDPIEVAALSQAYGAKTGSKQFCGIGSVKTNIGHLDTAAGVIGMIKVALSLENEAIPPSLNYDSPNPEIDFPASPFYVVDKLKAWPRGETPRCAAISSLGVGGTNAHVILQEAPLAPASSDSRAQQLFFLSAKNSSALEAASDNLIEHLSANPNASHADIAFSLQTGRTEYSQRRAVVFKSSEDPKSVLDDVDSPNSITGQYDGKPRSIAFMFTGQGAQFPGMGKHLYDQEPVYRQHFDDCCERLKPMLNLDLRELIFNYTDTEATQTELNQTAITQPALFALEYSLAQLWLSWGIKPEAMIGHSIGEYVAACLAGVFDLNGALSLIAHRGALMQSAPTGSMLAIMLSEEEVGKYLSDEIELAAVNAPSLSVVSGNHTAIDTLQQRLADADVGCSRLRTSHGFHSSSMQGILDEFEKRVAEFSPQAPSMPFISNLTGDWIQDEQAQDPRYWARHLRHPVRFSDGIGELLKSEGRVLLEIGPSATLSQLAKQHAAIKPGHSTVASLTTPDKSADDAFGIAHAIANLWINGVSLEWSRYYAPENRSLVNMPGYAFQRQRHWFDAPTTSMQPAVVNAAEAQRSSADWLYTTSWTPDGETQNEVEPGHTDALILVGDDSPFLDQLGTILESKIRVIRAASGSEFGRVNPAAFTVRAQRSEDYERLLESVVADGLNIHTVVYCLAPNLADTTIGSAVATTELGLGLFEPLSLLQGMAGAGVSNARLQFVTHKTIAYEKFSSVAPWQSLISGVANIGPLELPELVTSHIDLRYADTDTAIDLLPQLATELLNQEPEQRVVLAANGRLTRSYTHIDLPEGSGQFDANQTVLITGGADGLGLQLAKHLAAQTEGIRLLLVGKTELPPPAHWTQWLKTHPVGAISERVSAMLDLQALGAKVIYGALDIADIDSLQSFLQRNLDKEDQIALAFHAAGSLADGPLLVKTDASMQRVLTPKVGGTLALAQAISPYKPTKLILFSSISSLEGVPGQVDYAAANAFLDAFASTHEAETGIPTIAINWGSWQSVGMAARSASSAKDPLESGVHPLVEQCLLNTADAKVYQSNIGPQSHWLLDGHRASSGECVLPGTGFLELVKGAYEPLAKFKMVEMTDVMFLSPFVISDNEPRDIRVQIETWARGLRFTVMSQAGGSDSDNWYAHLKGRIASSALGDLKSLDLEDIRGKMSSVTDHPNEQHRFLTFGKRWNCIESLYLNDTEALIEVKLANEFSADLDNYDSHPALLDVATAGVLRLLPDYDSEKQFYVPIAYTKATFHGAMGGHWFSHIRFRESDSVAGDVAVFDVTVTDIEGRVVAEFSEFMLKCLDTVDTIASGKPALTARTDTLAIAPAPDQANLQLMSARLAESGIPVDEGLKLLDRIAKLDELPDNRLIVAPTPLDALLEDLKNTSGSPGADFDEQVSSDILDTSIVEQRLLTHDAVVECAVVSKKDRLGEVKVAAFVKLDPAKPTTISELRRFVRKELADEMVPSAILDVNEFAYANNGDIDRLLLPDPFAGEDDYVAPESPNEVLLTTIWQDILGIDRISITDNFFDLGGHSLLAVRVLAAIKKASGVRLEDVVVVTFTLEQTAAELDRRTSTESSNEPKKKGLSRWVDAVKRAGKA